MGITIVAIGAGLLIGFLTGGRIRHLGERSFRLSIVFAVGVALQLLITYGPRDLPVAVLLLSYTCIVTFAVANLDLKGMGLIAIGIGLNFIVIAANRGMPVDPKAIRTAGVYSDAELRHKVIEGKRHLQRPGDHLLWLSDIIPASLPGYPQVVSFGDLILYFGVADLMANLLHPPRRGPVGQARLATPYTSESDDGDGWSNDEGDEPSNTEASSR
ncbi:MAG: hypothetical protein QOG03_2309 [Actinomycetota bacterium]|jgi:hypothetical protein|nr:hypothetical protein [Actinomycetota bacterium]